MNFKYEAVNISRGRVGRLGRIGAAIYEDDFGGVLIMTSQLLMQFYCGVIMENIGKSD